jgi:hypothetical protein
MLFALILVLQQPVAPPVVPPPPVVARPASPIARVQVEPGDVAVQAGDTVRLRAVAYDSGGRALPGATTRWFQASHGFEGRVSDDGLVTAGSTGAMRVAAMTSVAGGKPTTTFTRITILSPPAARIVVEPALTRLYVGQVLSLRAVPYAANNDRRYDLVTWDSDAPGIVSVSADGRVTALRAGRASVTAHAGRASQAIPLGVEVNPTATLVLAPADTSVRTGDVVRLSVIARTSAGRLVPDVVPEYLVGPGGGAVDPDGAFVADEPGTYRVVASFAGRMAGAAITVRPRDAARPTTIVGRLPLSSFIATEFWLHPDGRHGYLGTLGDRLYAMDLSDPARPVITDSVMVDARTINDVMTTEDGKFGVMTREGASSRKNGIVVLSFEDPAHPVQVAEFTETVIGGVHSTYVYRGYVYLTDDATGSMRVIDIRDPRRPSQVARWETPRTEAGRTLHDIDVQDGLAYLSYWNDGLVILDVGNGIKGGNPENPQLVSQLKYDLNALYRDVEAVGGPGFIRGTHTAWRSGRYVFVGDEVFSAKPVGTLGPVGLGRAYGRLHVVDVSDVTAPRLVAWYEPKDGGAHNVWVAGDTLYLGDYQGGLRILDVSGELRGDLQQQGREIAHVATGDAQGHVPNAPLTWGVIYRNGLLYVPDMNSGLWVVKVEGSAVGVP